MPDWRGSCLITRIQAGCGRCDSDVDISKPEPTIEENLVPKGQRRRQRRAESAPDRASTVDRRVQSMEDVHGRTFG